MQDGRLITAGKTLEGRDRAKTTRQTTMLNDRPTIHPDWQECHRSAKKEGQKRGSTDKARQKRKQEQQK